MPISVYTKELFEKLVQKYHNPDIATNGQSQNLTYEIISDMEFVQVLERKDGNTTSTRVYWCDSIGNEFSHSYSEVDHETVARLIKKTRENDKYTRIVCSKCRGAGFIKPFPLDIISKRRKKCTRCGGKGYQLEDHP